MTGQWGAVPFHPLAPHGHRRTDSAAPWGAPPCFATTVSSQRLGERPRGPFPAPSQLATVDCVQLAAAVGPASLLAGVNQDSPISPPPPPCRSKLRASQRQQAAVSPRPCRDYRYERRCAALVKTRNSENAVGRPCKTRFTRGVRKRRAQARLCHHVPSLY